MTGFLRKLLAVLVLLWTAGTAVAQDLRIVTVERPPFAMKQGDDFNGFSIDLWNAVAEDLGRTSSFEMVDGFGEMLGHIRNGTRDAAVANISITAEREEVLDFSHTIFESGLQIMIPNDGQDSLLINALISRDVAMFIGLAFLTLFGGGMLMWAMERRAQPYFDRPAREAMFPSFWWALNLVVNGGFEERVPRTFFGRIFAVLLVISSLFIVSVFVAKITAVMTVDAIQGSVNSVNDLYGKRVATIQGSTSERFLLDRDLDIETYADLDSLLRDFEGGNVEAVVFDAPVLAFYVKNQGSGDAMLVGSPFRRESYGFALPSNSPLVEPVNRSLLKLRENGTYDRIYRRYFGAQN
jgi:polar amino acid transport system substrate-binding protein